LLNSSEERRLRHLVYEQVAAGMVGSEHLEAVLWVVRPVIRLQQLQRAQIWMTGTQSCLQQWRRTCS